MRFLVNSVCAVATTLPGTVATWPCPTGFQSIMPLESRWLTVALMPGVGVVVLPLVGAAKVEVMKRLLAARVEKSDACMVVLMMCFLMMEWSRLGVLECLRS